MSAPLTILIPTLDRRDILELTLWYIYETSTTEERNIFILDNGSQDDTAAFLGTLVGWPGIRCFRSEKNLGLAGAHKKMLPHVATPYIFTIDDDMWPLNKRWASGVANILDADPSICQLALGISGHPYNNYGIVHTHLDRPFFRVPPIAPGPRGSGEGAVAPDGSTFIQLAGETVAVPDGPNRNLPFAVSGAASAWRTADVMPLITREERHPVVDLSEAWGDPLRAQGFRHATTINYGIFGPSPGPLWHVGRMERYWQVKCDIAPEIYGRSSEEQRGWLEAARAAMGWGRPLEDPDTALP